MAIVDGLIVCVQLHGGAGRGRGRAGREADSLTPGSEFSHPLKERPDCVRVLSDKHLIPTQTHTRTHTYTHAHTRLPGRCMLWNLQKGSECVFISLKYLLDPKTV